MQSGRTLYRANLQTGALTSLGQTRDDLFGIAIAIPSAVPEPTSWATMIFGLGAIGSALRRRKAHKLPRLA